MGADKVDLKRLPPYRARAGRLDLVDVPPSRYLAIDGAGDPNTTPAFTEAVGTLYPLAYALKFRSKAAGRDYVVPPLEGLWWADDMDAFTVARDKARWQWTLLLLVPDWLDDSDVEAARETLVVTGRAPARLDDVRVEALEEGRCVQTLHVGSFDDEAEVLERIHHQHVPSHGLRLAGRHHEIYLSDVRRVEPARRRTILRQPVVQRCDPG
ncbi:MAG: hypothetical protein CMH83_23285 [Nocardioides sp.]|nr:hypothetical protein [Nocardioides sp.]